MRLLVERHKSFLRQRHAKPLFQMESQQSSELGLPLWFLEQQSCGILSGVTAGHHETFLESTEYPEYSCGSQVLPGLVHGPKSAQIHWSEDDEGLWSPIIGCMEIWIRLWCFDCVCQIHTWLAKMKFHPVFLWNHLIMWNSHGSVNPDKIRMQIPVNWNGFCSGLVATF